MIRLLVADDHALVREGLCKVFQREQDCEVVVEAGNGNEVIAALRDNKIDVAVLDFNMPDRSGLDLVKHMQVTHPSIPVLILSMAPEREVAVRLLRAGAAGFVSKQSAAQDIVAAVRTVNSGEKYISPAVALELANALGGGQSSMPHDQLSDREFQVLQQIASGNSTKDISEALKISVNTVATYRRRILEKLNLRTDVEITRYALKHSLVE
ncbi:response regulator [Litorivivens sp.]|uniref:response regulator n=1 Tax=Litorivivens sp. TaxID=2020868 RepID=UPI003561EE8B